MSTCFLRACLRWANPGGFEMRRTLTFGVSCIVLGIFPVPSGWGAGALDPGTESPGPQVYLAFEGYVDETKPEMGYAASQIRSLKELLGPVDLRSRHLYAFGAAGITPLTRSIAFLRAEVEEAFDAAERENVPLLLHIDPLYGFGANSELLAADAPAVKYWNDPEMREWAQFPVDAPVPPRIPRPWFSWGCWVSPAPAVPALGSPKFLSFMLRQIREGLAQPLAERVTRLQQSGKGCLYAGINIGWETCMFRYRLNPKDLPMAALPTQEYGLPMQPWEANAQLGYASLHQEGWNQQKLDDEARRRGVTSQSLFDELIFHTLHDYTEALAKTLVDAGLPKEKIYTHIVPMSTVNPAGISTTCPPVWTAVNDWSVPGFTMDRRGAAVYDLTVLKRQIKEMDPKQNHFAAMESYLLDERDPEELKGDIEEIFGNGGVVKVIMGTFGKGTPYEMRPAPDPDTLVIQNWLQAGLPAGH